MEWYMGHEYEPEYPDKLLMLTCSEVFSLLTGHEEHLGIVGEAKVADARLALTQWLYTADIKKEITDEQV